MKRRVILFVVTLFLLLKIYSFSIERTVVKKTTINLPQKTQLHKSNGR